MVEKLNKVIHVERQLVQRLGREPTAGRDRRGARDDRREVREIQRMAQLPISLERPVGEEDDSEFGDFVEDVTAESPFDAATLNLRREDIDRVLGSLPRPRARSVLELRYGLNGQQPRTLEEVGRAVRRHPRAHPPDREQHAEAPGDPARVAGPARRHGRGLTAAPNVSLRSSPVPGSVPEWLKGMGCKPIGIAYVGSNPTAPHSARSPDDHHRAGPRLGN